MYGLFTQFGFAELNLFTAFFVTLAFVFVYLACEGHPLLRAFTLVLAAAASGVYWSARPQIISFALAGVFAYVLWLFRWRGLNRLWVLPPLMAVWANVHGGFAIGFILIALTMGGPGAGLGLALVQPAGVVSARCRAGSWRPGRAWHPVAGRDGLGLRGRGDD